MSTMFVAADGQPRCRWCGAAPEFLHYHDTEWGFPVSKELKKLGWKFVGPTTVYAFMQAMGLINDHTGQCVIRDKVAQARARFERPRNAICTGTADAG
jgi:3-methyladenine DNA glycosylase Tag